MLMSSSITYLSSVIDRKKLRRLGGQLHDRHQVAEAGGEADHHHHHRHGLGDAVDQLRQVAPPVLPVDHHGAEEGVHAGDRAGFDGRERARQDPPRMMTIVSRPHTGIERDLQRLAQRHHLARRKSPALRAGHRISRSGRRRQSSPGTRPP
jgi:hypothetical protein